MILRIAEAKELIAMSRDAKEYARLAADTDTLGDIYVRQIEIAEANFRIALGNLMHKYIHARNEAMIRTGANQAVNQLINTPNE